MMCYIQMDVMERCNLFPESQHDMIPASGGKDEKKMGQLDDLFEQSLYVQKKKEEGREIGREEGLAEGLQKAFVTIVQGRFPPLAELAQERVSQVTKPDKLDHLLKRIVTIPDETTARWLLNTIAA